MKSYTFFHMVVALIEGVLYSRLLFWRKYRSWWWCRVSRIWSQSLLIGTNTSALSDQAFILCLFSRKPSPYWKDSLHSSRK